MIEIHESILPDLRALIELAYTVADQPSRIVGPAGLQERAKEVIEKLSPWTVYAITHHAA